MRSGHPAPSGSNAARPIRAAFVMEQTLGHVTHDRNLREVVSQQTDVAPTWLPISFDVQGPARLVPLLRSNWSVRASWRARRAVDRALAAQPHDVLLFHTQVTSLFSVPLMGRVPTIVSLDATPVNYDSVGQQYGHQPAGDGFLDRQKYRLNRRAFHAAARLIAWSDWAKQSLVDDYGVDAAKVRVLAPGASPLYFELGRARQAAPPPERSRVQVLFVGGDFQRKGGPLLLEAMRGPLGERCELHLVTRDAVPAQPNVHVYRGVGPNSPELRDLFAQADLFVLPTFADCLAVVLMEATAAGLPVVTTRVGALPEAVRPGDSGLLVPPGDGRALHQALETLVADATLRARLGRAGYALAREKFDARQNNRALLDLVVELGQTPADARRAA